MPCLAVDTIFTLSSNVSESSLPRTLSPVNLRKRQNFFQSLGGGLSRFFREFKTFDTLYIEPQHYKFQAMWQMINYYEQYSISHKNGDYFELSPDVSTVMGPYVGYSLIFLGYTLQLNNLYIGNAKKTFNLSLYSSLLGADFYFRDNNKFKIKNFTISDKNNNDYDLSSLNDQEFDGFHVKYWGFNLYYIFNHRRHSYPAAYNQSTCQKHSAGSPLCGLGYGRYALTLDWSLLDEFATQYISGYEPNFAEEASIDDYRYDCYSIYGGYSYNWAFAHNWLFGTSLTAALSYNKSKGESFSMNKLFDDFKFSNVSLDGVGRVGLVWNNTRFFAGVAGQVHSYTYSKSKFRVNNVFATINLYAGLNFGKKKDYRRKGKRFEF